jgi:hypothetical protein
MNQKFIKPGNGFKNNFIKDKFYYIDYQFVYTIFVILIVCFPLFSCQVKYDKNHKTFFAIQLLLN